MKENEDNKFMTELGIILFCILLMILLIPLLAGVFVALMVGATGLTYFTIVMLVASIIWLMTGLVYWV